MKKLLMLVIVLGIANMFTQNHCFAQNKLKSENCAYFQTIDPSKLSEWVFVGKDRSGKFNKWLELDNMDGATAYIETSRDEWSINLKQMNDNFQVRIDLFKLQMIEDNTKFTTKIINVKDSYDYNQLGGAYLSKKSSTQKTTVLNVVKPNVRKIKSFRIEENSLFGSDFILISGNLNDIETKRWWNNISKDGSSVNFEEYARNDVYIYLRKQSTGEEFWCDFEKNLFLKVNVVDKNVITKPIAKINMASE